MRRSSGPSAATRWTRSSARSSTPRAWRVTEVPAMPKVTFLPDGNTIEVVKGTSILTAAKKAGAQVGYACGGVCACSTCHVYVKQGFDSLSEQQEREEDILDKAFDV